MRIITAFLIIAAIMLFTSCEKPLSQFEATDSEAIFNVVLIDNNRVAELDILTATVPDTLTFISDPDTLTPIFWHDIDSTFEDFEPVISSEPVETEVGLFYEANVDYLITWFGTLNIFRFNNDADSLERYDKEFTLIGSREATCLKMGSTNYRRGWVLTSIGDAEFHSPTGEAQFFDYLYYHAQSNPDSVFEFGSRSLNDLVSFELGAQMRLKFDYNDSLYQPIVHIPSDIYYYRLAEPQVDPLGGFQVVLEMPAVDRIFGQLKFLLINIGDFSDDYAAQGYSYNYQIQ